MLSIDFALNGLETRAGLYRDLSGYPTTLKSLGDNTDPATGQIRLPGRLYSHSIIPDIPSTVENNHNFNRNSSDLRVRCNVYRAGSLSDPTDIHLGNWAAFCHQEDSVLFVTSIRILLLKPGGQPLKFLEEKLSYTCSNYSIKIPKRKTPAVSGTLNSDVIREADCFI